MAETKRILCVANSRKLSGRCVAGIEILDDDEMAGWIRPVSARPTHEVSELEREYRDGSDPKVLDIIDIPLLSHRPDGFQTENWLLDTDNYWVRRGGADWAFLEPLLTEARPLWLNGFSSSNGENDRVPDENTATFRDSLRLIRVRGATLRVMDGFRRREVRAGFTHAGGTYWLKVTDPVIERMAKQKENGDYRLGESAFTVSLGETFQGYAYKLVAAIMRRP